MARRSPDLAYVPYGELGGRPNVVVDGSPAGGTVLCLSHWPGIGSPAEFAADLSAQMAFRYLGAFDRHDGTALVSNNHFDQDGLVGMFALCEPAEALARRDLLVEVARAGDFAVTSSRAAGYISMAISALADPARSPLPGLPADDADYEARTAVLYTELLGRLPELSDQPERWHELWREEDATLSASVAAIAAGSVRIEELPDLDLAVVTVPPAAPSAGGHRFGGDWVSGLHPMAVHNATACGALLTVRGRHYELAYRYESWVQFRSRPVRARVDLAPLADRLNEAEAAVGGPAEWTAQPVSGLTPVLAQPAESESSLDAAVVRAQVESHLRTAPVAWDPYRITR
jgi:hypothetical protein